MILWIFQLWKFHDFQNCKIWEIFKISEIEFFWKFYSFTNCQIFKINQFLKLNDFVNLINLWIGQ